MSTRQLCLLYCTVVCDQQVSFSFFLRESPLGLAAFPNDDHLADVLSDALRLHPNSEWVCVDNDDCDGCIVKI